MTTDDRAEHVRDVLADAEGDYEVSRPAYLGVDYACVVARLDGDSFVPAVVGLGSEGINFERDDDRIRVFKEGR